MIKPMLDRFTPLQMTIVSDALAGPRYDYSGPDVSPRALALGVLALSSTSEDEIVLGSLSGPGP
jgi:hypothetical protein